MKRLQVLWWWNWWPPLGFKKFVPSEFSGAGTVYSWLAWLGPIEIRKFRKLW